MANYEIGKAATLTGTAAINGTTAVVGTSTLGGTEFVSGDIQIINGQTRIVDVVTDATHWTVTTAFTATASGLAITGVSMKNIETELGLTAQQVNPPNINNIFTPYTQPVDLASGGVRGNGWATVEWRFGFIVRAFRDAMRVYCPEPQASSEVYIRTTVYNHTDEYRYYSAIMIWPIPETRDSGRGIEFTLLFRALVQIT
jgi:hypothetical protein